MAKFREYVETSDNDGHYLREPIHGNDIVTYQTPRFAENLLLRLGYNDGDTIAYEVFYVLLNLDLIYTNHSGITPAKSFEDIDFDNPKISLLTDKQRELLLNMLSDYKELTYQQRTELERYMNSQKNITSDTSDSLSDSQENRIEEYDKYWLSVDMTRFLGFILRESDATASDQESSELSRQYNEAKKLKKKHQRICSSLSGTLPKYKQKVSSPEGTKTLTKAELETTGVTVSTGQGSEFTVRFSFKSSDDDIVLEKGYDLPPVWDEIIKSSNGGLTLDDLTEDARETLLNQARTELKEKIRTSLSET